MWTVAKRCSKSSYGVASVFSVLSLLMLNITIGVFLMPSSLLLRSAYNARSLLKLSLAARSAHWAGCLIRDYIDDVLVVSHLSNKQEVAIEITYLEFLLEGQVKEVSFAIIKALTPASPSSSEQHNCTSLSVDGT